MGSNDQLKNILVLDDDPDFRKLIVTVVGKRIDGVTLHEHDPIGDGVPDGKFDWSRFDVLLLDYYLCVHGVTGLDILQSNRKNENFPATIMLTGAGNEEVAVRAIKSGVYDYLRKEKLDKGELVQSIIDSHSKHKAEKERRNELTDQSHAFNKALFYQELEQKDRSGKRVLLIIELDNHQEFEEKHGVIIRDGIIRHIARQSFDIFKLGECNPSITRFSDISVALLIDNTGSLDTLKFNLEGLCKHLHKHPFKFDGKKLNASVSLGAIPLTKPDTSSENLLKHARIATVKAGIKEGNSYYIYEDSDWSVDSEPSKSDDIDNSVEEIEAASLPSPTEPEEEPQFDLDPEPTPETVSSKPQPKSEPKTEQIKEDEPYEKTVPELVVDNKPAEEPSSSTSDEVEPEPASEKLKPVPKKQPPPPKVEAKPKPKSIKEAAPSKAVNKKPSPKPIAPAASPEIKTQASEKPVSKTEKKPEPEIKDDAELAAMDLSQSAQSIKQAFDDKRAVQNFTPVISLLSDEDEQEYYFAKLQLLKSDGKFFSDEELNKEIKIPAFEKFIDRWMLRETISRITNKENNQYVFILNISGASLSDATFFNWIRKMLTGIESRAPGNQIILEMNRNQLEGIEKQASALISYMQKTHGFRFILSDETDVSKIQELVDVLHFDLVRTSYESMKLIHDTYVENPDYVENEDDGDEPKQEQISMLHVIGNKGANFMVDDVQDATNLTEAIAAGAHFASGIFIGEPMGQLDDTTNIESFEIV